VGAFAPGAEPDHGQTGASGFIVDEADALLRA